MHFKRTIEVKDYKERNSLSFSLPINFESVYTHPNVVYLYKERL